MSEDIKDIIEILELSKEEIKNNNENVTATLDLQDLKSLNNLYDLYNKEKMNSFNLSEQLNKEKEKNKKLFTQEDINKENEIGYSQGVYFTDEAWKDKIKEKIEKIKKRISKLHPASDIVIIDDLENQIKVLEELLEERN